jgi:hypothetical protein
MPSDDDVLVGKLAARDDGEDVGTLLTGHLEPLAIRLVARFRGVQARSQPPELPDEELLDTIGLGRVVVPAGERSGREPLDQRADALGGNGGDPVDVGRLTMGSRRDEPSDGGGNEDGKSPAHRSGYHGWARNR